MRARSIRSDGSGYPAGEQHCPGPGGLGDLGKGVVGGGVEEPAAALVEVSFEVVEHHQQPPPTQQHTQRGDFSDVVAA